MSDPNAIDISSNFHRAAILGGDQNTFSQYSVVMRTIAADKKTTKKKKNRSILDTQHISLHRLRRRALRYGNFIYQYLFNTDKKRYQ